MSNGLGSETWRILQKASQKDERPSLESAGF